MSSAFTPVSMKGAPGAKGDDGADGKSAYELAVLAGFVGSESVWLASLVGSPGTPGTPGTPGPDGADGLSAYEVAVANGYVGTEASWVASFHDAEQIDFTPSGNIAANKVAAAIRELDSEKAATSAIPSSTDSLAEGSTNQYFTAVRVRAVVLAGLSLVTSSAITAADTILTALGKLQAQITSNSTAISGKEPTVAAGSTSQYYRGDKSWQTLDKAAVGLPSADNTSDLNKPVSTAQQTAIDLAKHNAQIFALLGNT